MEEIRYYKTVYNRFWEKQTKIYGYAPYERKLVRLISRSSPRKVFEVGIGTGWPIGAALKARGIKVDGCDIARTSVRLAKKELANEEGIWTGDVSRYRGDEQYDVTYCVRASWYMPDIYKVIEKMISMTKPGGCIVFDVMDRYSPCCIGIRCKAIKEKCARFLGISEHETFGDHFISPRKMKKFLREKGLSFRCWGERELTHDRDRMHTPKVVFYCRKGTGT